MKEPSDSIVIIPRWVLAVLYISLAAVGVTVALASSPSLQQATSSAAATTLWGAGMLCSAILSAVASRRKSWEPVEQWAAAFLAMLLVGFAAAPIQLVAQGDLDHIAYSTVALALAVMPTIRTWALLRDVGRRRGR